MIRPVASLAALALAALLAGPAIAAPRDPDVPRPDPPGRWRIIDHTDEKSTSTCIGNMITPLCAVETDRGCEVRKDDRLCAAAVGRTEEELRRIREEFEPGYDQRVRNMFARCREKQLNDYERFRVVKAERARAENLTRLRTPTSRRSDPYDVEIGDIAITINEAHCRRWGPKPGCNDLTSKWVYFLRRIGSQWIVVDQYNPRVDY